MTRSEEHDSAVQRLAAALTEQDLLRRRHEAAIGTPTELGACVELHAVGDQVAGAEGLASLGRRRELPRAQRRTLRAALRGPRCVGEGATLRTTSTRRTSFKRSQRWPRNARKLISHRLSAITRRPTQTRRRRGVTLRPPTATARPTQPPTGNSSRRLQPFRRNMRAAPPNVRRPRRTARRRPRTELAQPRTGRSRRLTVTGLHPTAKKRSWSLSGDDSSSSRRSLTTSQASTGSASGLQLSSARLTAAGVQAGISCSPIATSTASSR